MQIKSSLISPVIILFVLLITSCSSPTSKVSGEIALDSTKGLKDYYQNYFPVGVAVYPSALKGEEAKLITSEFNGMTPENVMKMGPIHPKPDEYYWKDADQIAAFAKENNLKLRGHALCWHQQTPNWLFKDSLGNDVNKEELLARLKDHITTVVNRYKGTIYAWDVVNEAVADDSTMIYRDSKWHQICGKEFVAKAFEYAKAADPNAKLFYNDYNIVRPEKRERVYTFLKELIDNGVPIDGVGIQGHWSIFEPSENELKTAIEKYASLGLEVQITELDVSIYPWEKNVRERKPGESDEYTAELQKKQSKKYAMFFRVFREYKDTITGVTFWNISDKYSWLDTYPVPGRKNYPLLFDQNFNRKQAYWEVVDFNNNDNQ
ncbi:endo-1,4-beta-xylanase [Fulvivirga ligni]|uniref:endo-1,4-beta-xylanase n=1 Tax=Fulvivirga ligni TaxID=2904246 RepID=UPI001F2AB81F|nr:endo-1,4-beta-xylanase [Fulvivirga ligni]UII23322.1 endo-1,4-beta-xylanase [Fulvivirga ligni]